MLFTSRKKTYNEVLYEWLSNKKNEIKESTYLKYLILIETYIIDNIGNKKFKDLGNEDIHNYFQNGKICGLSENLKNNIFIILNASIKYGISKNYRKSFTIEKISFSKRNKQIKYFSKNEEEVLVKYLLDNMNLRNLSILLALFLGLRIGEICGLKWEDIDFDSGTLSVNRTAQRIKNINKDSKFKTKLVVTKPKTESSIRTIPLPEVLISILIEYKQDNNFYIFTNCTTIPKDPRAIEKYFNSILNKLGIKPLSFHCLRHTFATRLREQKVDIKAISELLGHSDWKITQSIYIHSSFDYKKQSINTFNYYLSY